MMAMRVSRRRILVGDSSKYGADSFVRFAHLSDFERFITDDALPVESAADLHVRGVEVVRV
jgi:DeoR family transcriptional regulator, fructose operon transcriptional repressor